MTSTQLRADPTNAEQARAWDGDEGEYWASHADQFNRSVRRYHAPFMEAAQITPRSRVLDVGCGTGETTLAAARLAGAGSALGVDLWARMLDVARHRAGEQGVDNVSFQQLDAQVHRFDEAAFDRAISRTGAMFFGDPQAAFTNICQGIRPGGFLVLLVWQEMARNEWVREIFTALAAGRDLPPPPPDAPGPFSLGDPARVRRILTRSGFEQPTVLGVEEQMYFGHDVDEAHEFLLGLLGWMLDGLDPDGRAHATAALRATLEAHSGANGVTFGSATWLVTAQRP